MHSLAALASCAAALQHASETLRADIEVVKAAVAIDGSALQHASDTLKADKEVAIAGVAGRPADRFRVGHIQINAPSRSTYDHSTVDWSADAELAVFKGLIDRLRDPSIDPT